MIRLFETIDHKEILFETTKFPDGTSQVWHSKESLKKYVNYTIHWTWEKREEELFHILQLIDLIRKESPYALITLDIPFLPYARQDKEVTNESTFALKTFANIINAQNLYSVRTFDVHSKEANVLIRNLHSFSPMSFHEQIIKDYKPDLIFYPDQGAMLRYKHIYLPGCYGKKVRNLETGEIEEYSIIRTIELKDKRILIIDDLIDAGNTFIHAAQKLKEFNPKSIALCISHGIFSQGKDSIYSSGISKIYYTNSLISNVDGYNIWE